MAHSRGDQRTFCPRRRLVGVAGAGLMNTLEPCTALAPLAGKANLGMMSASAFLYRCGFSPTAPWGSIVLKSGLCRRLLLGACRVANCRRPHSRASRLQTARGCIRMLRRSALLQSVFVLLRAMCAEGVPRSASTTKGGRRATKGRANVRSISLRVSAWVAKAELVWCSGLLCLQGRGGGSGLLVTQASAGVKLRVVRSILRARCVEQPRSRLPRSGTAC